MSLTARWPLDDDQTRWKRVGQSHFIVRWDAETERYICDCGHPSPTATDHELHASADQRAAEA